MDRSLRQSLGSVITDEGSKPEMLSRTAQTTAALTMLKPVWTDRSIYLSSKIRLMLSLVTFIFPYACESWTLTAELQRRIQAMEMRCYRKILRILYKIHVIHTCMISHTQECTDELPHIYVHTSVYTAYTSTCSYITTCIHIFKRERERGEGGER